MASTRRWPRVELALDVRIRFETIEQVVQAHTMNVSREGLFIAMDSPRPIGTRVRVRIAVGTPPEKYTLEGVVVRSHPDPDEDQPAAAGAASGIAVFLTATSAGWTRFCDQLAKGKPPTSGSSAP